MKRKIIILALIAAILLLVGCDLNGKDPATTAPDTTVKDQTTYQDTTLPDTTKLDTTVSDTTDPDTTKPGTTVPDTTEPETTAPPTTVPPTTVPPTTAPPTTEPPTTEPPTTAPPTTVPSTTEPPTTLPPTTEPPTTEPPTTVPPTTAPPTTAPPTTVPPTTAPPVNDDNVGGVSVSAPGTKVSSNEYATIDYSNTKDGYVMVCFTAQTGSKLKVQVTGPEATYTYNLTPGSWTAFPFSQGNGAYKVTVFENVTGTKYAAVLSLSLTVKMDDEFAPFLCSNAYVNFDDAPNAVSKAKSLCKGLSDPLKKVEAVYNFVISNLTYDYDLAATVKSGYAPDLDKVLARKKGICFDYAALMAGMLRSQGVPTKLIFGYAGEVYHAWINVYVEGKGWVNNAIYFDGQDWKRMDPTFASTGGEGMLDYIGDGKNYTAKYYY